MEEALVWSGGGDAMPQEAHGTRLIVASSSPWGGGAVGQKGEVFEGATAAKVYQVSLCVISVTNAKLLQ